MITPESKFSDITRFVEGVLLEFYPDYTHLDQLQKDAFHASKEPLPASIKKNTWEACMERVFSIPAKDIPKDWYDLHKKIGGKGADLTNAMRLVLDGIGEDKMYLNEIGSQGGLLDFRTVRDWDQENHFSQEEAIAESTPSHTPAPYVGRAYAEWIHGCVDDRFAYITLSTLSGHIYANLEEVHSAFIDETTPHEYVSNPDDGQRLPTGGILWSKRVDARGKEPLYRHLRKKGYAYITARTAELAQFYAQHPRGQAWLLERTDDDYDTPEECNYDAIFSDPEAMAETHWTSFVADTRRIAGDPDWLAQEVASEATRLRKHLEHLVETFDPSQQDAQDAQGS